MVTDYGPGIDAEGAFQKGFKRRAGASSGSYVWRCRPPTSRAYVQRANDLNPQGIFVMIPGGAQPAAFGKALPNAASIRKKTEILGQSEITDERALASMGDIAMGIITASHYDYNHPSKLNDQFVKAYKAEFKRNPDFFSIDGYDGMHLIDLALKNAGGKTDGESLIDAAKGATWESPRGPISIDPGHPRHRPDRLHSQGAEGRRPADQRGD